MVGTFIQPSFAKGEIGPQLYGRVDIAAYQVALRTARNVNVRSAGGVFNRPGLEYVAMCKDHTYAPRLIYFSFKTTDTYQLEFGNQYMRVIRNGAPVLETAKTITGATQANPVVITSAAHGYSNGDDVEISGVAGMTRLNGRRFRVAGVTANTFQLTDPVSGVNIDGTGFSAYTSGGSAQRVYTIATPYTSNDIDELKFVQSADIMTLCHRGFAVRELSRTAHTNWTLATVTFAPGIDHPATLSGVSNSGVGTNYTYKVTSIASETFEESDPTNAVTVSSGTTPNVTLTIGAVSGAARYAVYRLQNGIYGLLGETETTSFTDNNLSPDLQVSPPQIRNPFNASNDYPGVCGYYEQRRFFASTNNKPDTIWFTQTGNQKNLSVSTPLQADDAITATLNSEQVNEIRGAVASKDLLLFTSGSEFNLNSGGDSAFTANSLKQKPQSQWGSSHLRPLLVGTAALFVGDNQSRVRTFGYSLNIDGYTGVNIGQLSTHLLEGHTIVDWAYAQNPDSIIYMVRDDGQVLTLTYNQEQEVIAWTHWDTLGSFERVSVTRNGASATEDAAMFVVKRRINGQTVRYIEQTHSRVIDDVRDSFFVDSGLSFDDPVEITDIILGNPVVVKAPSHGFSNGDQIDLSDIVWESDFDGFDNETQPDQLNRRRYTIGNVTTDTFELTGVDGSNFEAYVEGGYARKAVLSISGLDHLEGRTLQLLADGNVVSNKIVVNGGITLPRRASRIHAGLKYISDVETLDIESPQGTIQGRFKKIPSVVLRLNKSRGLFVGPNSSLLTEMKQREDEDIGDPIELLTGDKEVTLESEWDTNGRVFIRQRYPLPMEVLAIIPDLEVGD